MGLFSRKKAAVTAPGERVTEPASPAADVQDNSELIAVITAAIAAFTGGGAAIKTIKRLAGTNAPVWSMAGRQEVMDARRF